MADVADVSTSSPAELLSVGRRHLAVRNYSAAVEALTKACELLAAEHGDTADQCAEAYLWYGKALLGLSREESGVLGDGMPGTGNADEDENGDQEDNDEEQNEDGEEGTEAEAKMETQDDSADSGTEVEKTEAESTTKDDEPTVVASSGNDDEKPGTSNGDAMDETMDNLDNEDDVDNLQLAWETLDLARSILKRRVEAGGGDAARTLLADVHLALGEVALESETYDKAVTDMMTCLEIQKELYSSDDRCIAETHYQIGLANSLASSFDDAVTHFKNAANILESRIKALESANPKDDATIKKYKLNDPFYSIEAEIKELKELLPEIQEKIQDMTDCKAETIKRVRETLCPENGEGSGEPSIASSTTSEPKLKPAASDISHLIKRKRKASDSEADSVSKKVNT
ncbi:PREDICTED: protein HGV2 [Papilio xuthus]|uniref:Protein HGV2 n=1 Tax=Papilio xuthus TaxID=66420 RepID=A0A194PK27_PAPXU|nr:PREDICTED: protein HGV2 [Papilio xuthus]KPI93079.1 Protein HGV2 [Papilio xuthus]